MEKLMSTNIVMHPEQPVKTKRFVAPKVDGTAATEYAEGRALYRRGKPIGECVTDDMCAGWLDAEYAGRIAYLRAMQSEGYVAAAALEVM
jgi:hypothetical protein